MALIYPSTIVPDSPPGEREIYLRLRDDPETSSWIVLHSLDIANHVSQVTGEVDFVIIIPGKGVVCIEVKSHTIIRRVGGNWYYGKNTEPDPRGPFKQVSSAMHSIRNYLLKKRPDFSRIVFWSAVIFPFASGSALTGEWHSWQLIDRSRFSSAPISKVIVTIIDNARDFLSSKNTGWFQKDYSAPYPEQCHEIAWILRPTFEFFESTGAREKRLNQELKQYTEEQFLAIDHMEPNPRVIFTGPAGTGKTLIALEMARRFRNAGKRTLFVCYNSLLGRWLKDQTSPLAPLVKTTTLHSLMIETACIQSLQEFSGENRFWNEILPFRAIERLLEDIETGSELFDELIVDEAQDIISDYYLDFLDLILKGGIASGRWRFFGDFEKQMIYRSGTMGLKDFLEKRASHATEYALRVNCRNTPRVAAYTSLLGGLLPSYRRIMRPDDGIEPHWCYYSSMKEQKIQVGSLITDLMGDGLRLRDIILLSPRSDSCAGLLAKDEIWKERLSPADRRSGNCAVYCTVHAFKGMESPVVILTDIEHLNSRERTDIFYIGVTRAVQRLAIFVANSAKKDIRGLIL